MIDDQTEFVPGPDRRQTNRRQADIDKAAKLAADLAYAQGQRDAKAAQDSADNIQSFATINSLVAAMEKALTALTEVVTAMRVDQDKRDAVNIALIEKNKSKGEKKLTRVQTGFLILGGAIALGSFLLTIVQSLHG